MQLPIRHVVVTSNECRGYISMRVDRVRRSVTLSRSLANPRTDVAVSCDCLAYCKTHIAWLAISWDRLGSSVKNKKRVRN